MKKILIIDDEPQVCETVKKSLEATGNFEVSTCTNSLDAIHHARRLSPDLILIDVMMPGLSGPDIVEQLENDEATCNIPYIYLTAVAMESEVMERENIIGGNRFVSKPFKTAELSRVIKLALEATQEGAKAKEPKRSYWADYRQIRMLVTGEQESWEATFSLAVASP